MTYDPIEPRELCEKNIQDSTKKGLGENNYTHDPYCPQAQMYQDNAIFWWDECQDDFDCRCELIAKIRDDERRWVLKKTAEQLRSHVVKNGVCACGGAVDDQSEHWLDIVDYYMMTLLPQHEVIEWY